MEPNGIQEVARSIRVSSTNKIKYLSLYRFSLFPDCAQFCALLSEDSFASAESILEFEVSFKDSGYSRAKIAARLASARIWL